MPKHQRTPSYLLDARRETVPFRPRPEVQEQLQSWLDDPDAPLSVQLVHGPGGRGKTRLANAFATTAHTSGWPVAQATDHRTTSTVAASDAPTRALIAVDYAERWNPDTLVKMIAALPVDFPQATIRVVLLARSPAAWPRLTAHLDRIADLPPPIELGDLTDESDRTQAFHDAAEAFRTALELPPHDTPPPILADHGSALTLHMAALAAVCADRDHDPRPELQELSTYLLNHERRFWPTDMFDQAATTVFVATLFGPVTDTGRDLLTQADVPHTLLKWHRRLYPEEGPLAPLRPDRLGEDYVAVHLAEEPDAKDLMWRLLIHEAGSTRRALTVLAAAADRHPDVRPVLWEFLERDPALAMRAGASFFETLIDHAPALTCFQVSQLLPNYTSELLQVSSRLFERVLSDLSERGFDDPEGMAILYVKWGKSLRDAGNPQGAVTAMLKGVELWRQAADVDTVHLPSYASTLRDLASVRYAARQDEEALSTAKQAVELWRRLSDGTADHLAELAIALSNLGAMLHEAGLSHDAIALAGEAVSLQRALVDDGLSEHRPKLAASLNNMVGCLSVAGSHGAARDAAIEATEIYVELTAIDRAAYLPDLALSLVNLGLRHTHSGDRRAGLNSALDAITHYRELAAIDPIAHRPSLAGACRRLAIGQLHERNGSTSGLNEAWAAVSESISIYEQLYRESPDMFARELAISAYVGMQVAEALGLDHLAAEFRDALSD